MAITGVFALFNRSLIKNSQFSGIKASSESNMFSNSCSFVHYELWMCFSWAYAANYMQPYAIQWMQSTPIRLTCNIIYILQQAAFTARKQSITSLEIDTKALVSVLVFWQTVSIVWQVEEVINYLHTEVKALFDRLTEVKCVLERLRWRTLGI